MKPVFDQLTRKKQLLNTHKPLPKDLIRNIEEWLRVELTYTSNAIEGNTLSRTQTAEVIERGVAAVISGKSLKEQLEAINHSKAVDFVKELTTKRKGHQYITEQDIRHIHNIILTGIDDAAAGTYRQTDVFIRGKDVEFPRPSEVSRLMKAFVAWLEGQQGVHPVMVAATAHFKFVSIHPFIDGNGRTARLLMNLILLLNGYPLAIIKTEERTAYLDSIYKAQKENDFTEFNEIIVNAVERSLDVYLNALEGELPLSPITKPIAIGTLLRIGELAKQTNEKVATIAFWTRERLLPVTGRTEGGYNLYDAAVINRVKEIRRLQSVERLTIEEIKERLK
jgi:cell filamentation protein, protein adenylyltransferase